MSLNRVIVAWVLALWSWSPGANGQEQSDATGVPGGLQFAPDSPMSFPSGATWIDESMPQGAIPGDRHISGGNVYIAVSGDGKQLFAFSSKHPKWVQPSVSPPGDPKIVLIADDNVAAAWSGAYCFAYSGLLGRWDVLELTGDEPARPRISRGAVGVDLKETDYIFRAEWGKWFSADDIKAGRVAEYLAEAPPSSPNEQIRVLELVRASADEMAVMLQVLLADERLSIVADPRTNSLIVRGPEAGLEIVEAICLKLDMHRSDIEPDPTASYDVRTRPVDLARLREQYESNDNAAQAVARKVRGAEAHLASGENGTPPLGYSRQQSAIVGMRNELRELVSKAFRARQELLTGEVADLERRTGELRQSIERREAIAEQVIDRRVDDLLDPSVRWDVTTRKKDVMEPSKPSQHESAEETSPPTDAQRAAWEAATVFIQEEGVRQPGYCGVVISREGLILTQLPASRAGGKLTAWLDDGAKLDVSVWLEPASRLAILRPTEPTRVQHYFSMQTPSEKLAAGQTLHLITLGYNSSDPVYDVRAVELTLLERNVLGFSSPLLQLQSDFDVYYSGSPVLNRRGELIGLNVISNGKASGGRVFAIPTATIIEICKESGFDVTTADGERNEATPRIEN